MFMSLNVQMLGKEVVEGNFMLRLFAADFINFIA